MFRLTHTYVILELSPEAYAEIRRLMKAAGYNKQFHFSEGAEQIDMSGMAVRVARGAEANNGAEP